MGECVPDWLCRASSGRASVSPWSRRPTPPRAPSPIGGDDQLTVLPYLDAGVLAARPKAFCGYSGNTNLLNY
jgi:hypothetical protein